MKASQLDQLKAQAQILYPLIREFSAELGKDRAYEIACKAMDKYYYDIGQLINIMYPGNAIEKTAALTPIFAADNALDYEEIIKTTDTYEYKVTGCRYADHYIKMGEPVLGYIFVCAGDFQIAKGINPDLELTRPQTIMQGADYCQFCYKLKSQKC